VALSDLQQLVEDFSADLERLNLSGDDQEAYSTMLCRLENQVDSGEPNWSIVEECRVYLERFRVSSTSHAA
jgi:hypothetical protein